MDQQHEERLVVVSQDSHAGAEMHDYKAYLPKKYRDEFDAWAATFHDPWLDLDDRQMYDEDDDGLHMGRISFVSPYSWESDTRLEHMDQEGIAAEVLFPNTVPPFFPSALISSAVPQTEEEYRYRWEGLKAHNRWMVDFCALAPERRVGLAQVFLNDIDDTVAEIRWAKEAGLKGVLMPMDHLSVKLLNIYQASVDPFWAVCTELEMPVHRHTHTVAEPETVFGPAATAIGGHEAQFFLNRTLSHLILGGVFERFPDLKFAITETGAEWVLAELKKLDGALAAGRDPKGRGNLVFGRVAEQLPLSASEYFARNCWIGPSLMRPDEMNALHEIGVDRIMWGGDYPHMEGTFPHGQLGMRLLFAGLTDDEVRKMLSENAANVYDLDMDALRVIADRIGPTLDEVTKPVQREELPLRTFCATIGAAIDAFARADAH